MKLSPQEKLKLLRQYEVSPETAILNVLQILSEEIDSKFGAEKEILQSEIEKNCLSLINDFIDKSQESISPEKIANIFANILLNKPGFLKLLKGDPGEKGKPGEKGNAGKNYILTEQDKEEIISKIDVPTVEKVIEKTQTIIEKPIITEIVKQIESQETALDIAEKLNTLESAVNKEVIKDLPQWMESINRSLNDRTNRTNRKNPPHGGGSGHIIEDEGTVLTQRKKLNFVGSGVTATDDSANNATVVTITAGGGSLAKLIVTGTANGVNKTFTIATAITGTSWVVLNGAYQVDGGVDYSISGTTITYVNAPAPSSSPTHWLYYFNTNAADLLTDAANDPLTTASGDPLTVN